MLEPLFDLAAEYDAMLDQGLRLSGENRHFFMRGRVAELKRRLPDASAIRSILDFGCGIGDTSRHLADTFPSAEIVGVDTAERALDHARAQHGGPRLRFEPLEGFAPKAAFDLCYVNGVFHHIPPDRRDGVLQMIRDALKPGGRFAFFENNPWNPGTQLVMRRIPFDRDAQPVSPSLAKALLSRAGFVCEPARFLFYFPRPLAALRPLEPAFVRVPLGAQYLVLARRPEA